MRVIPILIAFLLAGGLADVGWAGTGQEAASEDFKRLVEQAAAAREEDRVSDAVELYRQGLRLDPSWAEGWWYLGTLLYDQDLYLEARDAFRRLAALEPDKGPTYALMGLCGFQLRDYERALIDLQQARQLGLGQNSRLIAATRFHAAILLTRFEEYEKALEALKEFALQLNDSARVLEAMGLAALRMPFLPSEVAPLKRELVLLAGRAAYYQASRQIDKADRLFRELVTRFPDTSNVHYAYAVFLARDRPEEALQHFLREIEVTPSHVPARLQVAFEYLKRGQHDSAVPFVREAVELDPKAFAARNALGRAYLEMGRIDLAIEELETGVGLAPDSPEMYFHLAQAYARAGRMEDAKKARAEFVRLDTLRRSLREGEQAVGGIQAAPAKPPE